MTKAVDPFEEYLRKKKVEQLQQRYRAGGVDVQAEEGGDAAGEELVLAQEDPEVTQRLKEEMEEFFDAGGSAGANYFSKVGTGISEDKVEEIRDALEEVFEAPGPAPANEPVTEAFVDFFRGVETQYERGGTLPPLPSEAPPMVIPEILITPMPQKPAPSSGAQAPAAAKSGALDLGELLGAPADAQQLPQRVNLLCRLVAKLVERAGIPESEIIEVLIKSGVEF
ncbi:MAG: hypothetical protein ACT4PV_07570 [Planctomycetaceae bacterium]